MKLLLRELIINVGFILLLCAVALIGTCIGWLLAGL